MTEKQFDAIGYFKQLTEDGVQLEIRSNGFYLLDIPVEEVI